MPTMKDLMKNIPLAGQLEWIGLRPQKKADLIVVSDAQIDKKTGLEGDHYAGVSGKRQVTLIQKEHLQAVASILGQDQVNPGLIRRNLVISGINLVSLIGLKVQIGEEVQLKITGPCQPCSRMEENLGTGGYSSMRGHGGVTAKVIKGGRIQIGDIISQLK